jgi:acyl carrier protein
MHEKVSVQLTRSELAVMMNTVISEHGHAVPDSESADLRDIGFRSLDFSELALRVEDAIERELNFDAVGLRSIRTVGDVLDLLEQLLAQGE